MTASFLAICVLAASSCSSAAAAAAAEGGDAAARTIEFPWCVPPPDAPYAAAPHPARVGDTVRFSWAPSQGTHHVARHLSGACDADGSAFLGAAVGTAHTFVASDAGDVTFACDVGDHCAAGQIVTFRVVAADAGPVAYPPLEDNPCYLGAIAVAAGSTGGDDHDGHDHGHVEDARTSDATGPAWRAPSLIAAPLALFAALF